MQHTCADAKSWWDASKTLLSCISHIIIIIPIIMSNACSQSMLANLKNIYMSLNQMNSRINYVCSGTGNQLVADIPATKPMVISTIHLLWCKFYIRSINVLLTKQVMRNNQFLQCATFRPTSCIQ